MIKKEFDKLFKENKDDLHYLIRLHCMNDIFLTDSQLSKVIKERDKKGRIYGNKEFRQETTRN